MTSTTGSMTSYPAAVAAAAAAAGGMHPFTVKDLISAQGGDRERTVFWNYDSLMTHKH